MAEPQDTAALELELKTVQNQLGKLQKKEMELGNENKSLCEQMLQLGKQVTELEDLSAKASTSSQKAMASVLFMVEQLRSQKQQLVERAQTAEHKLMIEQKRFEKQQREYEEQVDTLMRNQIEALSGGREAQKIEQLQNAAQELDLVKSQYENLMQGYKEITSEYADLTEKYQELQTRKEAKIQTLNCDKSDSDWQELESKVDTLTAENGKLKEELSNTTLIKTKLEEENKKFTSQLDALRASSKGHDVSLEKSRQIARQYKERAGMLQTTVEQLNAKIAQLVKEHADDLSSEGAVGSVKSEEPAANGLASASPRKLGCKLCGERSHTAYNCPEKVGRTPLTPCPICKVDGHWASDCPIRDEKPCPACQEKGHFLSDCPKRGVLAHRQRGCYKCGKEGHILRDCKEENYTARGMGGFGRFSGGGGWM